MRVAYLKLELSVLLKSAKDLRLPPTLFVLVLTLWKRRTPIYAAPGTALPGRPPRDVRSAFRRSEGASPVQR